MFATNEFYLYQTELTEFSELNLPANNFVNIKNNFFLPPINSGSLLIA